MFRRIWCFNLAVIKIYDKQAIGNFSLIGAPVMFIGVNVENSYSQMQDSWFTGAWGIV
jgi:hypothetical protein